jgi:hypothetical protein
MWLTIVQMILGLTPAVVNAIQTIHGDQVAGASKKQMAQDTLQIAVNAATGVLAGNPQNQALAAAADAVASVAIDQAVNIAKATGTYQKATAIANAAVVADTIVSAADTSAPVNPGLHA